MWLPAQISHDWSPFFLKLYGQLKPLQTLTWKPMTWRGLEFTNPLGISGGVDKNADCISSWWTLGPGFVEVGTVTPKAQEANPGKVLDREIQSESLWNHMGFPNKGIDYVLGKFKNFYKPHFTPIFVNIGKNRHTPLDLAHEDYIYCIKKLAHHADAFIINISSPNTKGLRDLLKPQKLSKFLTVLTEACANANIIEGPKGQIVDPTPLLLKMSPDISESELHDILKVSLDLDIDGWVLTNTTSSREERLPFPKEGGVSGRPLLARSKKHLKSAIDFLGDQKEGKLLISSGGIMTPGEALERLEIGADLVQIYSALVFHGPFFFRQVAQYVDLQP